MAAASSRLATLDWQLSDWQLPAAASRRPEGRTRDVRRKAAQGLRPKAAEDRIMLTLLVGSNLKLHGAKSGRRQANGEVCKTNERRKTAAKLSVAEASAKKQAEVARA